MFGNTIRSPSATPLGKLRRRQLSRSARRSTADEEALDRTVLGAPGVRLQHQRIDQKVVGSRPALGSVRLDADQPFTVCTALQNLDAGDGHAHPSSSDRPGSRRT